MLTRRKFVGYSALTSAALAHPTLAAFGQSTAEKRPLRLAVLGSVYRHGSHLQTIADRFLVGYPHEGDWHMPEVQVVSLYLDQADRKTNAGPTEYERWMAGTLAGPGSVPPRMITNRAAPPKPAALKIEDPGPMSDLSEQRTQQFGFRLCRSIPEALRCDGRSLAVDAVLTVIEDDGYPRNDAGRALLPQYDFFQQCAQVFETEGKSVPYFNHRQLSYSFSEAQEMVKTADRLRFPLLAGASMPITWRLPDTDVPFGAKVPEAVMVGPAHFDDTDFDALEAMQSMIERRKGGETGVRAVQLIEGDEVWDAYKAGRWSRDLLSAALSRSDTPMGLSLLDGRTQDLVASNALPQLVKDPAAYCIEYTDGTRATLLLLNGAIRDYNIAARVEGLGIISTQFFMTPVPNEVHSACLTAKIEQMYQTRTAPYSIQRALLTTGLMEACLASKHRLNQRVETPQLNLRYRVADLPQYTRA